MAKSEDAIEENSVYGYINYLKQLGNFKKLTLIVSLISLTNNLHH